MSTTRPPTALDVVSEEVRRTLARVDPAAFDRFVDELRIPDRRWFCTGQGRSGLVAQMAAMRLMHLGHTTHVVGETTAPAITAEDVLLVLSASGSTPLTLHFAKTARDASAVVVALTATAGTPVLRLADAALEVPASASTQFGGSLFEQSALLVLDAAILAVDAQAPATRGAMQRRHANLQ